MAKRIFKSIVFVAIIVLLTSVCFISRRIYLDFIDTRIEELRLETDILGHGIERDGIDFLDSYLQYKDRITVIDSDGTVIFDNSGDIDIMDNHLDRQEVKDALLNGYGISTRFSSTLTKSLTYSAIRINNGWIVRLSSEYSSMFSIILSIAKPLLLIALVMITISSFLARNLARKIVEPLNDIDVDNPNTENCYVEIKPFMDKISNQQKQISSNMVDLERRKHEFETITENMNEGMVLFNHKGVILETNKFAAQILNISEDDIGKKVFHADCNEIVKEVFTNALDKQHYNQKVVINNITYEIEASPVKTNEGISGLVLLIYDISYKEANERIRKEFSSNVSHELKTPLQTISGYAELLKSGLVKENDQNEVADKIYSESQRMISLINDIIKLSHLDDEEISVQMEKVDIYTLAQSVVENLTQEANKNNISITLSGNNNIVNGNVQLLESVIFNLVDNAIKYNKPNGSVEININKNDKKIYLTIKDTGIGIDKQDYERIFERFYQADKARSKSVGGTGLGLSIVKHALILNNANIAVDSKLGIGTTFTVTFDSID